MTDIKTQILVLDDEQKVVKSLSLLLESEGFATQVAQNGLEALQILNKQNISAVICGLARLKIDGLKLLAQLREQKSYLPFIFLTESTTDEDKHKMASQGAYRLQDKKEILKVPDTLREVIKQHQEIEILQAHPTEETEEFLKILHSAT